SRHTPAELIRSPRIVQTEVAACARRGRLPRDRVISALQRRLRPAPPPRSADQTFCDEGARLFDGVRAGKPTVIADGHVRANCGPKALIGAITVSVIRDVLITPDAAHACWMSMR